MDKPVAVVASIQTLNNRFGTTDLEWLRKPGLVVVDECHHAITPSYSALLRWLDAELPRPGAADKDEPAIVGSAPRRFAPTTTKASASPSASTAAGCHPTRTRLYARLLSQGVLAIRN